MKLANLVDYQDKAVVSRTIIDKKAGTVTLFSFDAGQALCEHMAPYDAMCYIVDGEADVSIAGKNFHMKEGDMLILPEHRPHSLKAPKRFKMLLTMIATG
jgi:quercetin dioxygenase-like cupin family protein